ncbi:hypothetical protein E4U43_004562 [Claviceps pusilla]|uniref:Uncharacterized protein n=1 Tax=Claviceps pusilla TaxID=123648 RepID=A0A9P7SWT2_9HYPO|nr:hypothetical protein E4U43_004562 [Claviceps pusilla]
MQFSTSAILATIALVAGQTAAQCEIGLPTGHTDISDAGNCEAAGRNRWSCGGDGTMVYQAGSRFTVHTGSQTLFVNFLCDGVTESMIKCPATVWGSTTVSCAGELSVVYLVPKA